MRFQLLRPDGATVGRIGAQAFRSATASRLRRTWGHSGYFSSVGFLDPEHKVVVALVYNGMLESQDNRHNTRVTSTLDAVYEDLGFTAPST
jgi:Beta-lactamase